MRLIYIFLVLMGMFNSNEIKGQDVDRDEKKSSKDEQKWGLSLHLGARKINHEALESLFYGETIGDKLSSGYYLAGGYDIRVAMRNIYVMVGINLSRHEDNPANNERLEVNHTYANFSLGYGLLLFEKLSILPQAGISIGSSEMLFSVANVHQADVNSYLEGAGDTHRLALRRNYLRSAISFEYELNWKNGKMIFPLCLGVNVEYLHAISQVGWKNATNKTVMDGPNSVFQNSLYAGIFLSWWL